MSSRKSSGLGSAVDVTAREVIVHGGDPIQALYSSSSGGHTENNENVWGGVPVPYLRGVPDPADDNPANPNHTWRVKLSWWAFSDRLSAYFGTGRLDRFRILRPLGVSGRVTVVKSADRGGVKIVGRRKTARASGWSVRSALSLKDTLFRVDVRHTAARVLERAVARLDGAPGWATGPSYAVAESSGIERGRAQDFENGRVTRTRANGRTVWQWGPVLDAYDERGREASALGMPVSNVWGPGAYLGATYENGMIVWSEAAGAHVVLDPLAQAYRRRGGGEGPLGLPAGEQAVDELLPGGVLQPFEAGTIYVSPNAERAYALWGRIDRRYRSLGLASSVCGYPKSSVFTGAAGSSAKFENGTITFSDSSGLEIDCG
jgi:LGFP repeat